MGPHICRRSLRGRVPPVDNARPGGGDANAAWSRAARWWPHLQPRKPCGHESFGSGHRAALAEPGGAGQSASANLRSGQHQLPSLSDAGAVHGNVWADRAGLSGGYRFREGPWPHCNRHAPQSPAGGCERSSADVEKAFHVRMQVYQHPTENRTFYAPDVEPSVPSTLPIVSISGLNNYSLPHPNLIQSAVKSGV